MMRFVVTTLLLINCACAYGQIRPSRTWDVEPLSIAGQSGLLPLFVGSMEIVRGFSSVNGDQAWQYRLHVVSEIYRFTDSADALQFSTSFSFHHELTANTYNDISFNPRTAKWEEQVSFHAGYKGWLASAGVVHRCKHDIDNLFGPNEYSPFAPSPIQRTVILTGPQGHLTSPLLATPLGNVSLTGGIDWYAFNVSDNRALASASMSSWAAMQGAAWLRATLVRDFSQSTYLRCSYWASVPWFSNAYNGPKDRPFEHEAHAEVALGMKGASASLEFFGAAEHLFDDVSSVGSGPTSFGQFGLRIRPR